MPFVIGLTGPIASGKDIASKFLINKGYIYYSLSQVVREEADSRNIKKDREQLQNLGNFLREKYGNGVLADKIIDKLDLTKNIIIDGIRNPGEVDSLRKIKNFILVGVNASKDTRFERLLKRNKISDPKTYKEFLRLEARDRGEKEPLYGQQVEECLKKADIILNNEFENTFLFEAEIEKILNSYL